MKVYSKSLLAGLIASAGVSMTAPVASAQEVFIGEIREFPYNFCPRGWTEADGKPLPINQNQALFSLLGTNYGGDGRTTFNVPNYNISDASAPASAPASGEVQIFQHCGFVGWKQSVGLGDYKPGGFGTNATFEDNTASSVKISEGWEVELFDGANLDGESVTLSGDESCLVGKDFNDKASSMTVRRKSVPAPVARAQGPDVKACIALIGIFPSRN